MDLTNRQQLIEYLQSHGLYTKKKLGQNFLVDRNALNRIVDAAELSKDDCVVEVGPGLGVLTDELVTKAHKVFAIELDQVLAGLLRERVSNANVINSNILDANIQEITKDYPRYKVVANIPYYITSKILRFFLEADKKPELIVLLTQKEVAERICARPGDMSILSVSVQYYGQPEIVGLVPRESFFPAPEVDSAILRVRIKNQASGSKDEERELFRCVHIGFSSRRKTLLNNLSAGYHLDKKTTLGILLSVGLNDKTRAQELSVEGWQELCSKKMFEVRL